MLQALLVICTGVLPGRISKICHVPVRFELKAIDPVGDHDGKVLGAPPNVRR